MEKELLYQCIEEVCDISQIPLENIPDIDLYMDQVTTFMEEKLKKLKRDTEDSILTKTMINNYTKDKLLPPPVKKKYSRKHMMSLILIYQLKQILSIQDIQALLGNFMDHDDTTDDTFIYESFLAIQQNTYEQLAESTKEQYEKLLPFVQKLESVKQDDISIFLLILSLISSAHAQKRLAEKLIDQHFKL